jgi:trypsin
MTEIVGGVEVNPKFKYPYMVYAGGCGASLIAPNVLLCAAHCQGFINSVQIGRHRLNDSTEDFETFSIAEEVPHPLYGSGQTDIDYDYMVMRLDGYSTYEPVQLDNGEINLSQGKDLITMGWGTTSSGGPSSNVLLEVEVDLWSEQSCKNAYGSNSITDRMLCAARSGKDSCQGDSGGPIIDKSTGKQVGIVSWGRGCAMAAYPGVYAKVQNQIDWINGYIDQWYTPCNSASDCDDEKQCTIDTCEEGVCKNVYKTCPDGSYCEESSNGQCTGTCTDFNLILNTDNYGSETSWEVSSLERGVVKSGSNYESNGNYDISECLPMNAGTFTINDSFGDGICCQYGQGSYELTFGGTTHTGGNFGSSETITLVSNNTPSPTAAPTTASCQDDATFVYKGKQRTCAKARNFICRKKTKANDSNRNERVKDKCLESCNNCNAFSDDECVDTSPFAFRNGQQECEWAATGWCDLQTGVDDLKIRDHCRQSCGEC